MIVRTTALLIAAAVSTPLCAQDGWTEASPREEIRPKFLRTAEGRSGRGSLVIEGDGREGLDGYWTRQFEVSGGKVYRFDGYRKASGLEWPQQNAPARIRWLDAQGKRVLDDRPLVEGYLNGFTPWAPGEFPVDTATVDRGWTQVAGSYRAPTNARKAIVELHLQWAPRGRIEWSDVDFTQVAEPAPRIVKLAAAHLQPHSGKTPVEKCMLFEPLIQQAAGKGADLIVLGETVNYYDTGREPAAVAEPIPGPSTECFAGLARKHRTHIVVSLYERDRHLVYNAGVLITPDGRLAGKYRKVTLPEGEVENGVAPGAAYPVFDTKFGRLGIMICYDGFFPEVARELTKRGAEVIAWPVWGVNPDLAKARAAENHVYIVSSTYEAVPRNWGLSAVWDHSGRTLSVAQDWGTIAFAEVDLNALTRWRSLGDFRSRIPRHMPLIRDSLQFEPAPAATIDDEGRCGRVILGRRQFLAGAAVASTAKRYRVAVIGHTGRGNYGHGLDTVWQEFPEVEVVAVADADAAGLAAAVKRLGNPRGFADYRQMLDEVKPDLVTVSPRWVDQHCEMVVAAAERGVRGIYLEKPLCRTLDEADRMQTACERNKTKLAIAFQTRYSQKLPVVRSLIESGKLGRILEFRTRDKEDRRGGGEGLFVLGPHMFNLITLFGGAPEWCLSRVLRNGQPIRRADVTDGAEGIGPLAGDEIHAMYRLAGGATAYFDSVRDAAKPPSRFGLQILGSEGIIQSFDTSHLPEMYFMPDPLWVPGRSGKQWIPISSAGLGQPEPLKNEGLAGGNVLAVKDLIAAVEENRQPLANLREARVATEMVVAAFESQRLGGVVQFPLSVRQSPLSLL